MPVIPKPISLLVGIPNLAERLEKHSIPEPMSGCWIWIGSLQGSKTRPVMHVKYGSWHYGRWNPTRIAYFIAYGVFDERLNVCHHCDNELCVNYHHLFLGTQLDNNRDRHLKGRTVIPGEYGEQRYNAILTEEDIPKIFELYARGVPTKEIARQFNIARQSISNVLFKRAWRHITNNYTRPTPIRPSNQKIFGSEIDRLLKLRGDGWTYTRLAQEFNISIAGVQGILKRNERSQ